MGHSLCWLVLQCTWHIINYYAYFSSSYDTTKIDDCLYQGRN